MNFPPIIFYDQRYANISTSNYQYQNTSILSYQNLYKKLLKFENKDKDLQSSVINWLKTLKKIQLIKYFSFSNQWIVDIIHEMIIISKNNPSIKYMFNPSLRNKESLISFYNLFDPKSISMYEPKFDDYFTICESGFISLSEQKEVDKIQKKIIDYIRYLTIPSNTQNNSSNNNNNNKNNNKNIKTNHISFIQNQNNNKNNNDKENTNKNEKFFFEYNNVITLSHEYLSDIDNIIEIMLKLSEKQLFKYPIEIETQYCELGGKYYYNARLSKWLNAEFTLGELLCCYFEQCILINYEYFLLYECEINCLYYDKLDDLINNSYKLIEFIGNANEKKIEIIQSIKKEDIRKFFNENIFIRKIISDKKRKNDYLIYNYYKNNNYINRKKLSVKEIIENTMMVIENTFIKGDKNFITLLTFIKDTYVFTEEDFIIKIVYDLINNYVQKKTAEDLLLDLTTNYDTKKKKRRKKKKKNNNDKNEETNKDIENDNNNNDNSDITNNNLLDKNENIIKINNDIDINENNKKNENNINLINKSELSNSIQTNNTDNTESENFNGIKNKINDLNNIEDNKNNKNSNNILINDKEEKNIDIQNNPCDIKYEIKEELKEELNEEEEKEENNKKKKEKNFFLYPVVKNNKKKKNKNKKKDKKVNNNNNDILSQKSNEENISNTIKNTDNDNNNENNIKNPINSVCPSNYNYNKNEIHEKKEKYKKSKNDFEYNSKQKNKFNLTMKYKNINNDNSSNNYIQYDNNNNFILGNQFSFLSIKDDNYELDNNHNGNSGYFNQKTESNISRSKEDNKYLLAGSSSPGFTSFYFNSKKKGRNHRNKNKNNNDISPYSFISNNISEFSNEIVENTIKVDKNKGILEKCRQKYIIKIYEIINIILRNEKIDFMCTFYGSSISGLAIENSDVDIMVKLKQNKTEINYVNKIMDIIISYLKKNNINFITNIIPIYTASVPVIKLECDLSNDESFGKEINNIIKSCDLSYNDISKLFFDITFFEVENEKNTIPSELMVYYIKESINLYPQITDIIYIMKRFLFNRKLNKSYQGGISSYSLFLLTLAFIKYFKNNYDISIPIGSLLIEYLNYYSNFNFYISEIQPSKNDEKEIFTINENNSLYKYNINIIDPITGINVAKSTFKIEEIQKAFKEGLDIIISNLYKVNNDDSINNKKILDLFLSKIN